MRKQATALATSLLNQNACLEADIGQRLATAFDKSYGDKWHCFVGRTCDYARASVHAPGHQVCGALFRVSMCPTPSLSLL